jgi:hypothetical protein
VVMGLESRRTLDDLLTQAERLVVP